MAKRTELARRKAKVRKKLAKSGTASKTAPKRTRKQREEAILNSVYKQK